MAIAVDLDGTLAEYDGWQGVEHIGKPIAPMMERVQQWIMQGEEVVIFTARVAADDIDEATEARRHIRLWLIANGLAQLDVTCIKSQKFKEFWDDRAIQIIHNTGLTLQEAQDAQEKEERT